MVILIIFAISSLGAQFYGEPVPGPGDPSTWKTVYPLDGGGLILAVVWGGLAALTGYHAHNLDKKTASQGAVSSGVTPERAAPPAAAPPGAPVAPAAAPPRAPAAPAAVPPGAPAAP